MKKETWLPLRGFEDLYMVSDLGRIKSLARVTLRKDGKKLPIKEKIMKPSISKTGYLYLTLTDRKKHFVHRLVASTFLNYDPNRPYVNHKDFNKTNNYVNNLEWCTSKENTSHAIDNGKLKIKGEESHSAKLIEADVINIFKLRSQGSTYKDIASIYNIDQSTVGKIIKRKLWSHLKVPVFFLLMLFSFTSNAQTSNDSIPRIVITAKGDTLLQYTVGEARQIAHKLIQANECDTLKSITEEKLLYKDSIIMVKDSIIDLKDSVITQEQRKFDLQQEIIKGKDKEIIDLRLQNSKFRIQKIGLTIGTITLGVGLAATVIYLVVKK